MINKHFRLGLKLWSTNIDNITTAEKLIREQKYSYVELFAVPGSYSDTCTKWYDSHISFVIHAAHFTAGMDLSDDRKESNNRILIEEAKLFADKLKASHIIFHPGVKGNLNETSRQLGRHMDNRFLIENVPLKSLDMKFDLLGSTPLEINKLLASVPGLGFCLDIVHAVSASNSHKVEHLHFINELIQLKPTIVHLADTDKLSTLDQHLMVGKGSLPIKKYLSLLPDNQMISLESVKDLDKIYALASAEARIINGQ